MKIIILFFIIAAAFYFLYSAGLMSIQSKRAVLFLGSVSGKSARFSSCTGCIKRILRFRDSRSYRIFFNLELAGGDASAEILDSAKRTVLRLDSLVRSGSISVEKGKRYYLVLRFRSATGSYTLNWD